MCPGAPQGGCTWVSVIVSQPVVVLGYHHLLVSATLESGEFLASLPEYVSDIHQSQNHACWFISLQLYPGLL